MSALRHIAREVLALSAITAFLWLVIVVAAVSTS